MYKLLMLLIGVLLLGGCPNKTTNVAVKTEGGASHEIKVDESTAPPSAEAENATASAEPISEPAAEIAGNRRAHTPSKAELEGKWFALYGGVGAASGTYTYENGHQIEFMGNGMARWSMGGGNDLSSKWEVNTGEIVLSIENPDQLGDSYKATPLGFGRDDEIGLMSASGERSGLKYRFKPLLDGGFLALMGRNGEMMVYGRVNNNAPDSAPDVSGSWKLVPATGQIHDAEVKAVDSMLQARWGSYRSQFEGNYTHGYWVGTVTSTGGMAFAAVHPGSSGGLDGVISTEPYNEMATTFDFSR
ncbi:MAG: hypothetical protein M3R04_05405 [bacterium]|nr:hypothetical protein [bacterium]